MGRNKSEQAHVFVFIILILIGIVGFIALAVDGGRVYAERRRMQSAADTAAYAAALAASKNQDFVNAALSQARLNLFEDADGSANPSQQLDVEVYNPPIDGPFAPENIQKDLDPQLYFQVKIRSQVKQIFSQFLNRASLDIQVEAVAYLRPQQPLSGKNAIIASSPNRCKGIWFQGDGATVVSSGSVFSNSNRRGSVDNCDAVAKEGSGGLDITSGGIYSVGSFLAGSSWISAAEGITEGMQPLSNLDIPVPNCPELLTPRQYQGGSAVLEPGYYADGLLVTAENAQISLKPGVYCFDNDLSINSGSLTGQDVLLIIRKGTFHTGGSTQVQLSARANTGSMNSFNGMQWDGMLLYMPEENNQAIQIGGGSASTFRGTVYAPGLPPQEDAYKCRIEGSGASLDVKSSINCYSVEILGNASVTIDYQAEENFYLPAQVQLAQ
jgi:hypothetical protein